MGRHRNEPSVTGVKASAILLVRRKSCPHRCHDGGVDGLDVSGGVQQHAALWVRGRDFAETLVGRGRGRPRPGARIGRRRRHALRLRSSATDSGTSRTSVRSGAIPKQSDLFGDEGPVGTLAVALIRQRGVEETVADDPCAGVQCGLDRLRHMLRPGGEMQQGFGARATSRSSRRAGCLSAVRRPASRQVRGSAGRGYLASPALRPTGRTGWSCRRPPRLPA